jgi:putative transposase
MFRKGYCEASVKQDQQAVYYMTFTVVGWIDVFTQPSPEGGL